MVMTGMKEKVYMPSSLKTGGTACLQSHMGKYPVLMRGRRWERVESGIEPLLKFSS